MKKNITQLLTQVYQHFVPQLGEQNQAAFFATLRLHTSQLWERMFEHNSTPEALFTDCFTQAVHSTQASDQAHLLAQEMFEYYVQLSSNNIAFQDGALDTIHELSAQGFITGIITNGIETIQLAKVQQMALQEKVDHVIVSAQARQHKPHQPVFDLALSKAGVSAAQAWQVGDHAVNDVAGAIRAGMSGLFYNPNQLCVDTAFAELSESPTHVIEHLSEVVSLAVNES